MADEATDVVTIPRAEFDAMRAELRRLQLAEDRAIALARIKAYRPGQPGERTFATVEEFAQALELRG
jgi:hypothetical protein